MAGVGLSGNNVSLVMLGLSRILDYERRSNSPYGSPGRGNLVSRTSRQGLKKKSLWLSGPDRTFLSCFDMG